MKKRLFAVFLINIGITVVEFLGGILSNSNALISDSLHNLQDSISQLLALLAIWVSEKGQSKRYTFGFKRVEILAALLNAVIITILALIMILRSVKRILNPEFIKFEILLPISVFGFIANFVSILILHEDAHRSLNVKSSYLHLLGDTLSSIGVVMGAVLMKILKIYWVDGLVGILIAIFIMKESFEILKESIRIFLQGAPFPVDEKEISDMLSQIKGIKGVHHIHIWSLKDGEVHFEAHVKVDDIRVSETQKYYTLIDEILREKYGVTHVTLQFESGECRNENCVL
ncbi:MAG: cation diffusion facilitator family transporter [Candidatus Hydrothermia bacterium]